MYWNRFMTQQDSEQGNVLYHQNLEEKYKKKKDDYCDWLFHRLEYSITSENFAKNGGKMLRQKI